jgi:hypothetical protein
MDPVREQPEEGKHRTEVTEVTEGEEKRREEKRREEKRLGRVRSPRCVTTLFQELVLRSVVN